MTDMLASWVRQTTTTVGTGDLTLAAVTGYPLFSDAFPAVAATQAQLIPYAILDDATGAPIEMGLGSLTATSTFARTRVIWTYVSGTLSKVTPAAVTLAAGTKRVICTMLHMSARLQPTMPVQRTNDNYDIFDGCLALNATAGTVSYAANILRAELFNISVLTAIESFLAHVTTATVGGECVMGLYSTGKGVSTNLGTSLIAQSGAIDCSTTGLKVAAVSGGSIWVPPGEYLVARWNKVASTVYQTYTAYSLGTRAFVHGFGQTRLQSITSAYSLTMPSALESLGSFTSATPGNTVEMLLRATVP